MLKTCCGASSVRTKKGQAQWSYGGGTDTFGNTEASAYKQLLSVLNQPQFSANGDEGNIANVLRGLTGSVGLKKRSLKSIDLPRLAGFSVIANFDNTGASAGGPPKGILGGPPGFLG